MALLREVHPGELGLTDRARPARRRPSSTALFDKSGARHPGVPLPGIARELEKRGGFFFANLHAPDERELQAFEGEFRVHPLAIEDVRSRHQRPKIDIYGDQYFLVFYRIGAGEGGADWQLAEIDFFIGSNFLVVTHDAEVPLLEEVFERFCRQEGKKDISGLLYEILDALVDEYFPLLDHFADRAEEVETGIFHQYDRANLERLLALKRDLALLRRVVAPERETINVLLRRDPPILEAARIFYFQDIYDHLVRVTDSIDTYRELLAASLDAFLSAQNNMISEVVRRLTLISIIFLPLTFVTGFFGMNFARLTGAGDTVFIASLALMAAVPLAMIGLLRRKGLE